MSTGARSSDADRVVGLDVGTTSVKAVAFDAGGSRHASHEAGYPLREPSLGAAEQDPAEVLEAALDSTRATVSESRRVAGIALSTAMHSLVALDDADAPLTQLITWADGRAALQAERLRAEHPELHARTGTPAHPMAPLPKLMWFRENRPEVFRRARRWVGLKELLVHRLTGQWLIDASCASGTGLMSLEQLDWDQEALSLAGVSAEQLPRIVSSTEVFELTEEGLGLAAGTPVVIGAGDGPLANLGVGAVRPGVAACSIGTSGALRLMVERAGIDPAGRLFCYALTPRRWVVGGAINNGGSVLQWTGAALAPDLGEHAESRLLELAGEVPAGSEGLLMLPYLLSERAPDWSPAARGAYIGLRHFHGRGHLIRAAIEGVCQQLALVLASMREAGSEVRELRATGGFSRSPLWCQTLSDVLGMPVGFASGHEGSAFGAALLGMEALGMVESIDRAADLVRIERVSDPDPDAAALYAELRPVFEGLHDALAPTFRALANMEQRGPTSLSPTPPPMRSSRA
jgi:gluconokinase